MTIPEMESRFFELKGKLAVGQLTEAEFKTELEKLRFQDAQGRWWMIGAQSGRWYYYQNGRWLIGTPPQPTAPSTPAVEPEAPRADVPAASVVSTPPSVPPPVVEKKEKPKQEAPTPRAPASARPVMPAAPPKKAEVQVTPPSPIAVVRIKQAGEIPTLVYAEARRGINARLIIAGAAVLGILVVIALFILADQVLLSNKPISTFISRTLSGQATATPVRPTPTVGLGASVGNLLALGDKLFDDGQIDPALAQYQTAAKLDATDVDTQIRLANAYALVGRLTEANAAANKAVALEPNNAHAHAQLSRALAWSGQPDAAIAEAQKALSLDANIGSAHAYLCEAYLRAGRLGDAQKEADAALKANPQNAETQRAQAWFLIISGKPDEGVKAWQRVVELAPNLFFYHFEFGEVLRVYLNDPAKSVSEYQRVSQLYPPYVPAYISLGQAYLALNQPGNGILQFQKAITFDAHSVEAYAYLGAGFKMQDKCSQAIPYFQKALELNAKFAPAARGLDECGVTGQAIPAVTPQGTPKPVAVPTSVVPLPPASPATSATKSSPQPATAAITGKITFAMFDGQYHLFLYSSPGGKRLLVELASAPMLNSEGTQVLFHSWQNDARGIHRIDADGTADEQISLRSEDTNPTWSPDGTRYAYSTRAGLGADVNARPFTIRIGDPTVKAKQDPPIFVDKAQQPTWSSQDRLVYRDCGLPTDACGLALIDPEGGDKKQLTTVNSASPAWSPDGTKVAFMSDADRGNWDIWAVSATGGSPQRLTDDPAEDGSPAWSPDGKLIAFVSKRGGAWALWVMNADGTNQRKLVDLGGDPFGTIKGSPSGQPGQTWIEQRISWSK